MLARAAVVEGLAGAGRSVSIGTCSQGWQADTGCWHKTSVALHRGLSCSCWGVLAIWVLVLPKAGDAREQGVSSVAFVIYLQNLMLLLWVTLSHGLQLLKGYCQRICSIFLFTLWLTTYLHSSHMQNILTPSKDSSKVSFLQASASSPGLVT